MKNLNLTQEQFEQLNKMLTGIAKKYAGWGGISYEDILQECWLKALTIIDSVGEMPSLSLIASSCYNRIFDLCRYQKRRVDQIPVSPEQFEYRDEAGMDVQFSPVDGWNSTQQTTEEIVLDSLVIDDLENLFNAGSVEQEYVHLVAVYLRIKQPTAKTRNLFNEDSAMENSIAISLGYASSMSSGYRNCKRRVRKIIAEHYGWGDRYNYNC